jgi:hypothetical protein
MPLHCGDCDDMDISHEKTFPSSNFSQSLQNTTHTTVPLILNNIMLANRARMLVARRWTSALAATMTRPFSSGIAKTRVLVSDPIEQVSALQRLLRLDQRAACSPPVARALRIYARGARLRACAISTVADTETRLHGTVVSARRPSRGHQ